jgi:transcriptional regulator with XRE-family HTH domain
MNQEKIGKFIAKCRKDRNITQEQLAEKLGVTNKSVSRWENGVNMPDYSILKELCNILDIDVNEFLSGEKLRKNEIQSHSIENLDLILKEYYKMKKQRNIFKYISICVVSISILICIFGVILHVYSKQYNLKGISNILSVYIDEDREKEYVGELDGYEIYVENLRVEELNYRTFNAKYIMFKDALDKKMTSIEDWRKGAWYIFKEDDTEILRYESYEIAISKNECIIRPISKYKSVDVKCHTDNVFRTTLKKGNSFSCFILDKEYNFKIKSINKDDIVVTTSKYGLTKVKDDGIDLKSKEKEFIIEKNKKVELSTQLMDHNESVIIEWY